LNAAKDGQKIDQGQNQAAALVIKANLAKAKESENLETAILRKSNAQNPTPQSISEAFADFSLPPND
jgi:hypothetical protein